MLKSLWLVATGLLFATGCTEESGAQRCLPGTTQSCVCVSGASGVQSCLPSGTAVGPCECVDTDTRQDTSGDTQTPDDANDIQTPDDDANDIQTPDGDDNDIQTPDGDDTGHERDTEVGPNDVNSGDCPIARITIQEGNEVSPQTVLHLSGESSTSAQSEIVSWAWAVFQPNGSISRFLPSPFVATPTFEVNTSGTYRFRLSVFDAQGNESCVQAEYVVNVTTKEGIRVELFWHTPGDPDETDTGNNVNDPVGSDVDLHVLHPNANHRYFDFTYDCHWQNPNPDWGFSGVAQNPILELDDADGAGPEVFSLADPEENARYRIGVHYWNNWGFGESFATVRIYIRGELREEWANVRIVDSDLWESHYIEWPSGTITRVLNSDGTPSIIPRYPVPYL